MIHRCHAFNCTKRVQPEMLMCGKHWAMVPGEIQLEVWKGFRNGQCNDKRVSSAWVAAAHKAIAFVAKLEGEEKASFFAGRVAEIAKRDSRKN